MISSRFLSEHITNYKDKNSIASRLRARRSLPLRRMIESVHAQHQHVMILDVGGTHNYWNIFNPEFYLQYNVIITLLNLPGTPPPPDTPYFRSIDGDGCSLEQFENNTFHIAHSNSVIEHVGDWRRQVQFAAEVSRIAQLLFIQTPNYWFPIEPHCMTPFIHWLPKPLRVELVRRFSLGHWPKANTVSEAVDVIESSRLLTRAMFQELFSDARVETERFLLLPKSFIAIRD